MPSGPDAEAQRRSGPERHGERAMSQRTGAESDAPFASKLRVAAVSFDV